MLRRGPEEMSTDAQRVVIPGYANLREFSQLQGHLLRAESWLACGCGSRAPLVKKAFGGSNGGRSVAELTAAVAAQQPKLVRLHRHRQLSYDHALLVYGAQEAGGEVRFTAYDPAAPQQPVQLTFDRVSGAFALSDDAAGSGAALGVVLR